MDVRGIIAIIFVQLVCGYFAYNALNATADGMRTGFFVILGLADLVATTLIGAWAVTNKSEDNFDPTLQEDFLKEKKDWYKHRQ